MYNIEDTLNIILQQQMFERWTMLVWISCGCLGVCLLIQHPLVNGAGDAMLRAICSFLVMGHLLCANMDEWIKVLAAEAEWASGEHVGLGHLG